MTSEKLLIKDRVCGSCSVCCVSLRINTPELKKKADIPCANIRPQGGCSIYKDRPSVCKTWYCGWRMLDEVDESLRPDKCGLLIKKSGGMSVSLMLIKGKSNRIMWDKRTLELIRQLRERDVSVSTSVPTKAGYCNAKTDIDDHITPELISHNPTKAALIMKALLFRAVHAQTNPEPRFDLDS